MMFLKKVFLYIYYRIKNFFSVPQTGLYTYKNYKEYKQAQIAGNLKKIDRVWASEENIKMLADYLRNHVPNISFGICHGTRRGEEQKWFSFYLGGIKVIGTEISPTATQFPNTIEWDFHEVKEEWIDNTDFIYSNSFDHSYKPAACLDAWMSCVKKNGVCIIEWSNGHVGYDKLDPFGGTLESYKDLIQEKYVVKNVLKAADNQWYKTKRSYFLIITHK